MEPGAGVAPVGPFAGALALLPPGDPAAPLAWVRAHGRVNLIGEHTDYAGGFVIPITISRAVRGVVRARADGRVRIVSEGYGSDAFVVGDSELHTGGWTAYPRAVVHVLAPRLQGLLTGFDLALTSDLPADAGLSSSAAVEAAVAHAALAAAATDLEARELAELCRTAEQLGSGVACGIMDQSVILRSVAGAAMLLDCRSGHATAVPFPSDVWSIVAIDTRKRRTLASSAYNDRRQATEDATTELRARYPAVVDLSDVTPAMLAETPLPSPLDRRARHVVGENERVMRMVVALLEADLEGVARLMAASHASLRDDYEVSCPELDALVAYAAGTGVGAGSRLTGAGFGGCTVNLVPRPAVTGFVTEIQQRYLARFGLVPPAYELTPGAPAAHGPLAL
ncbi:MAG: galactokinase [Actinobacteria bacterium]|nr:galactokinase [Actinomycetota bacterium]